MGSEGKPAATLAPPPASASVDARKTWRMNLGVCMLSPGLFWGADGQAASYAVPPWQAMAKRPLCEILLAISPAPGGTQRTLLTMWTIYVAGLPRRARNSPRGRRYE
ncbi:hypothetical protein BPNSA17_10690 [Bordetella petrii]